jgi:predicted dithiol-disulfide oxidoreductase (DUF899 family)
MTTTENVEAHAYKHINEIPHLPIVLKGQSLVDRKALRPGEKELTKQRDRINAERRRLPMVKIEAVLAAQVMRIRSAV